MAPGQYQSAVRSLDTWGRPTGGTATHIQKLNISVPDVSNTSPRRDSSKSGLTFFAFFEGGGSTEMYLRTLRRVTSTRALPVRFTARRLQLYVDFTLTTVTSR